MRVLILPNIKAYEAVIRDDIQEDGPRRGEAEMVVQQLLKALEKLEKEQSLMPMTNGMSGHGGEAVKESLVERIGPVVGTRVAQLGRPALMHAIVEEGHSRLAGAA